MELATAILLATPNGGPDQLRPAPFHEPVRTVRLLTLLVLWLALALVVARAAEQRVVAPGGGLAVIVSDDHGLSFRLEIAGKAVLKDSPLGLGFEGGVELGPAAAITKATRSGHAGKWENRFGNNRFVRDNWRELRLTLEERATPPRTFGLIMTTAPRSVTIFRKRAALGTSF